MTGQGATVRPVAGQVRIVEDKALILMILVRACLFVKLRAGKGTILANPEAGWNGLPLGDHI